MAIFANSEIRPAGTGAFGHAFANIQSRFAKRRIYTRTLNELQSLSDRELSDLGLSRSSIRSVAHDAAYGEIR